MATAPARTRTKSSSSGTKGAAASSNGKRSTAKKPAARREDAEALLSAYRDMVLVREFERQVIELFRAGELPGFLHVAIGQEAVAVGVSASLEHGDWIGSTHRAHGHILARGTDPMRMMAELMGRKIGFCEGKGGSMHVADLEHHVVGANGVVGAGAPMMTGVALAQQQQKTGKVAVAFYGDGASNQGNVYEAMNLAQLWKLPVLFVLEDNSYAESTPKSQHSPVQDMSVRGLAMGMKTLTVDGNDFFAVRDAAAEARAHAVSGKGPVYLVCNTTRLEGHYVGDAEVYRPKGEAKSLKAKDPIARLAKHLITEQGVTQAQIDEIDERVEREMLEAVDQAREAELPPAEDAMTHVYTDEIYPGPALGV